MLVITRKEKEGLRIGNDVSVTVIEVNGDRVKLGFDAPEDVKIIRNELYFTEKFNVQASMIKLPADLMNIIADSEAKGTLRNR